ncbi:MAG: enoyl-CoA hydratase/isomerase family protein [Rhodococcus sp.]|jgi:enoyl-CoA hydratase/carnithine racemase|nr:enoyl-CoA hydratase/isomerase family protein [Rhodococcus sp. (in: high G+C Gram-positive bacteria)]
MDSTTFSSGAVKTVPALDGAPRLIKIDRPEKANALDAATVTELYEAISAANGEGDSFALASTGRVFCGGFDFTRIERESEGDLMLRFARIELLLQAVSTAPVASFALVDGAAFGAGADLVAACTYRIGTSRAKFRFPGFRFGVALGTRRLANIVGTDRARAILLENRTLSAEEAMEVGLLTHLVDELELVPTAERLLAQHAGLSRAAAACLLRLTGGDTNDADLADLIRSLAPKGLHERIARYRDDHGQSARGGKADA